MFKTGGIIGATILGAIAGAFFTQLLAAGFYFGYSEIFGPANPTIWHPDEQAPEFALTWLLNGDRDTYERNVRKVLVEVVRERSTDPAEVAEGERGAAIIAKAYVDHVAGVAGLGNGGWWQSVKYAINGDEGPPNCERYCDGVYATVSNEAELAGTGWTLNFAHDSRKGGWAQDFSITGNKLVPLHSFVYAQYLDGPDDVAADYVLDPWATNRPDIYDARNHLKIWPIPE